MTKKCSDCPSFLPESETAIAFGRSAGAPMCARFGHLLGRPDLSADAQEKIEEAFAGPCASYGDPRQLGPSSPPMHVGIGVPEVLAGKAVGGFSPASSCLGCENFIEPKAVKRELGWTFGLCAATGRLIFPNRYSAEARTCGVSVAGSPRWSTTGFILKPVYEATFVPADAVTRLFDDVTKRVEPSEYPTDKPVSAAEMAAGIRAWEKIASKKNAKRFTYIPIFDASFFDESERLQIPVTGSDEHPELFIDYEDIVYKIAVCWRERDETPFLWGKAGVGKTEVFRHLAWRMQVPFARISLNNRSEIEDVVGKFVAEEKVGATVTTFVYGRLPIRWTRVGIVLLDEFNTAPEELEQAIRPLTDNSKEFSLDQNRGERLPRCVDCYPAMTGNPAWDPANSGAHSLAAAAGNRLAHFEIGLPPEALERRILTQRAEAEGYVPTKEELDTVMGVAKLLRDLIDQGTLQGISWGLRSQIKVLGFVRWFDLIDAYRAAGADELEPEVRKIFLDAVRQFHVEEDVD